MKRMKLSRLFPILFMFLFPLQIEAGLFQHSYTGIYQSTTDDIILTLTIKQEGYDALTGTLKSSNGAQFILEGTVSEGIAAGVLSGNEGSFYFEAFIDGNDLTISLIEPDQFNMPDYNTAEYLVMSRTHQQPDTSQPQSAVQTSPREQVKTLPPERQSSNISPGTEIVKDDINGYSFNIPDGWVHQQGDGQILLGSNTIPGVISVFPHQAGNMQELLALMNQGIQEVGVLLSLSGEVQQKGSNLAQGDYHGTVQGEKARGYGIGLLSQYGGGIFVLAVSTPEKLGQEIRTAADYLAGNTQFSKRKTGDGDLVRHFSGEWAWTNGYRTEWMTFFPDGTYSDQSEASYSGNMTDGSGYITGNWGVAGENSNRGRWSIRGNMDSGMITVINPDGSQTIYEYRVFIERGEKYYREYLLNGYHYRKQKNF